MKRIRYAIASSQPRSLSACSRNMLREVRALWSKLCPLTHPGSTEGLSKELQYYLKEASFRARLRLASLESDSLEQTDQDFRERFCRELPQLEIEIRLCERISFLLLKS